VKDSVSHYKLKLKVRDLNHLISRYPGDMWDPDSIEKRNQYRGNSGGDPYGRGDGGDGKCLDFTRYMTNFFIESSRGTMYR
jgi:hypothetical protein